MCQGRWWRGASCARGGRRVGRCCGARFESEGAGARRASRLSLSAPLLPDRARATLAAAPPVRPRAGDPHPAAARGRLPPRPRGPPRPPAPAPNWDGHSSGTDDAADAHAAHAATDHGRRRPRPAGRPGGPRAGSRAWGRGFVDGGGRAVAGELVCEGVGARAVDALLAPPTPPLPRPLKTPPLSLPFSRSATGTTWSSCWAPAPSPRSAWPWTGRRASR